MLAQPTLPLDLIDPCMEMMKAMMPSEREFVRVIVEVIIDLRDDEEPTEEPTEIVCMLSLCYPYVRGHLNPRYAGFT